MEDQIYKNEGNRKPPHWSLFAVFFFAAFALIYFQGKTAINGLSVSKETGQSGSPAALLEARGQNSEGAASSADPSKSRMDDEAHMAPVAGVELPIVWGDLGKRMVESGVIDEAALRKIYESRGGLSKEELNLLTGSNNGKLVINRQNSSFILNLLWAAGLANKNPVLENGPMKDPRYGGADRFASTGGWTLAKGGAMAHYSAHELVTLTPEAQARLERVSQNVYRPCCDNSTFFPDCNHGMAMLGLLALGASYGMSESDLYTLALTVNAYWFPDQYRVIEEYLQQTMGGWKNVAPQAIVGKDYSSASGYANVVAQVKPKEQGGGSCGI